MKSLFIVLVALIAAPSIALAQTACPESADCPEGSVCQCDEEGNVIDTVEVLDLGGYDFFGTEDTDERRNVRRFDDGSVVSEFDDDNDGVIDRRWTSIRDEQGRNILFEVDEDADGTPTAGPPGPTMATRSGSRLMSTPTALWTPSTGRTPNRAE